MKAKEAYEIAKAKGDIQPILEKIFMAANEGKTEINVPLLNEFQVKKLTDLDYMVMTGHTSHMITSRSVPDVHVISWKFTGIPEVDNSMSVLTRTFDLRGKT